MKKDFELMVVQHETAEANLRKRHQEALNELTDQLEQSNKHRAKSVVRTVKSHFIYHTTGGHWPVIFRSVSYVKSKRDSFVFKTIFETVTLIAAVHAFCCFIHYLAVHSPSGSRAARLLTRT